MIKIEECIEHRIQNIRDIQLAKAKEYATENNRFHNFDAAACILNITPEQALQGMMMVKHIVSVFDLIEWAETNTNMLTKQIIDEKIGDIINYLILREGLLLRRIEERDDKI